MKGAQTASVQFYVSIFIWSYCFAILKVFSKWTECSFHKCGFWDLQLSIVSSAVCISSSLSGSVVVTKYWRLSLGKQAGSLPERTPQKNEEYWARACQTGFIGAIALSQNISLAEALKLCSLVFLVHGVLTWFHVQVPNQPNFTFTSECLWWSFECCQFHGQIFHFDYHFKGVPPRAHQGTLIVICFSFRSGSSCA